MDKIDVSFCIPVYNAEKYLEDCVKSIVNQDYGEYKYEIILVEDCSPDNSYNNCLEIQKNYKNITVVKNEANSGVSFSRNQAIKLAKGEYIWFVDSDDMICKNVIHYMLDMAYKENTDAILGYRIEVQDSELTYDFFTNYANEKIFAYNVVQNGHEGGLYSGKNICSGLYRSLIAKQIEFNIKISHAEDMLYAYEFAMRANKIIHTNFTSCFYRQNPISLVHVHNVKSQKKRYEGKIEFYKVLGEYYKKEKRYQTFNKMYAILYSGLLNLASIQDKKYIKEQLKILKKEKIMPRPFSRVVFELDGFGKMNTIMAFFVSSPPFFWLIHLCYKVKYRNN